MDISVIISIYKNLKNLELILMALDKQSFRSFEVIVSEDNDAQATKDFLEIQRKKMSFPIIHTFQEDKGFRKSRALNQSLRQSKGEIIAFLDGDCIPHKHFLRAFKANVEEGYACFGRRVFLTKEYTQKLLEKKDLGMLSLLRTASNTDEGWRYGVYLPFKFVNKKPKKGIYGCNWAILKKHLLEINGFDEDYEMAGFGEDTDVEWRLEKMGIQLKSTRNKAIVYHLYHNPNYSEEEVRINELTYNRKFEEGNAFCKNGIVKIDR
jgi:glycosyltransferase involved in cell wall biosynthesis